MQLKLNFIIRLNGTIAKYSRLCHKVGRRRSQRHLVQDGDGRSYNPNFLVAPVVIRREIISQFFFTGVIVSGDTCGGCGNILKQTPTL